MKCPNCGTENESNAIFCSCCNQWILGTFYEETPAAEQTPAHAQSQATGKHKRKWSHFLIVAISAALLLAVPILLWPNERPDSFTQPELEATPAATDEPKNTPPLTTGGPIPIETYPPIYAPHVYVYSENYLAPVAGTEKLRLVYNTNLIETTIPMDEDWQTRFRVSMKGYSAAFLDENQNLYHISENSCNFVSGNVLDFQMNAQGGTIVYVDANGQLNLYRSSTGIRIDEIITYGAGSFVVSPNGQYCAYLDLALNIYKNGESRRIAIEGRGSTLLSISNDGSTVYLRNSEEELVMVYADGTMQNWGKMLPKEPIYLSADHSQILFRGVEENFLCTGWHLYPMPYNGDLQPVNPQGTGIYENGNRITYPCDTLLDQVYCAYFDHGLQDFVGSLYYVDTYGIGQMLEYEVFDFALDNTGTYLYFTDAYANLQQCDPRSGTRKNIAPEGAFRFVLSPDGQYICYDTTTKMILCKVSQPDHILYEVKVKNPEIFITKDKVLFILTGTQLFGYRFTAYGMDFHYDLVQECWLSDNGILYMTYPDTLCYAKANGTLTVICDLVPPSVEEPDIEEVDAA